jgi:Protein of unknown function with HXXEE motif
MDLIRLWPYPGLAIGALLAVIALSENGRGQYNKLIAKLALPVYILHQFEEHGIDAFGEKYAFQAFFCDALGFSASACPCDDLFIFAVNVGTVWLCFGICSVLWKRPKLLAASYGLVLTNAVGHLVQAIVRSSYNPGLLTALLFFVPLSLWTYRTLHRQKQVLKWDIAETVLLGILMHVWLGLSIALRFKQLLSYSMFIMLQPLAGFQPLLYSQWKGGTG